jgi:PPOX class probable F420-dependent enzyme
VLATIAPDGQPRLVPVCFVLHRVQPVIYSPIDEKPKVVDQPRDLARLRDIDADRRVSILVDRWDEDWARLAWLRCRGMANILEAGDRADERATAIAALRAKYAQYVSHHLETRPIIRIEIERTTSWGALALR